MVAGSAGGSVVGDPNNGVFTTVSPAPCSGLTRQTGNAVTVSFVRTPDGQLIAATTGTSSTCFLTDNLGSAVGIVSSTGVKTTAYAYDPYGRTRTATRPNAAANAFRYAGGLFATTTGATKFGARYYVNHPGFAGDSVSWEGWGHVEKIWELPEGAAGPCCSDGGGGSVGACFGVGGH